MEYKEISLDSQSAETFLPKEIVSLLELPTTYCYAALEENVLIAICIYYMQPATSHMILKHIQVSSDFRKQGIAVKLIKESLRFLQEKKVTSIYAKHIHPMNDTYRRDIFIRSGFLPVSPQAFLFNYSVDDVLRHPLVNNLKKNDIYRKYIRDHERLSEVYLEHLRILLKKRGIQVDVYEEERSLHPIYLCDKSTGVIYVGKLSDKEFYVPFLYVEKGNGKIKDLQTISLLIAVFEWVKSQNIAGAKLSVQVYSNSFFEGCMNILGKPESIDLINEYTYLPK